MNFPAIILGVVIAGLAGALYHLWRGGGPGRIGFYLALSLVGFFGSTSLAHLKGWRLIAIGQLDVGFGVLGALLFLFLGDWLSKISNVNGGENAA